MSGQALTIGNFCACMGPIGDDPFCPCAMRAKGLPFDENKLKWSEEDKERLMKALRKMAALERVAKKQQGEGDVPTAP